VKTVLSQFNTPDHALNFKPHASKQCFPACAAIGFDFARAARLACSASRCFHSLACWHKERLATVNLDKKTVLSFV